MNKKMIYTTGVILILITLAIPVLSEYPSISEEGAEDTSVKGIITAEPPDNIVKAEMKKENLIVNTPATFFFIAPELPIYQVFVTGNENENDVAVRIESLEGTSKLANTDAPGTLYRNVNVWAGTEKIKDVSIRFRIENSWFDSNNVARSEIRLMGNGENGWNLLDTKMISEDNTHTYFESRITGFSQLALSGLKEELTPFKQGEGKETSIPKAPGFEIAAIIAATLAVYLYGRKENK